MNESDLDGKSIELKKELMKLNSQIAVGTAIKNPSSVKQIKRTIAKILTIKEEKQKVKDNQKGGAKKE